MRGKPGTGRFMITCPAFTFVVSGSGNSAAGFRAHGWPIPAGHLTSGRRLVLKGCAAIGRYGRGWRAHPLTRERGSRGTEIGGRVDHGVSVHLAPAEFQATGRRNNNARGGAEQEGRRKVVRARRQRQQGKRPREILRPAADQLPCGEGKAAGFHFRPRGIEPLHVRNPA